MQLIFPDKPRMYKMNAFFTSVMKTRLIATVLISCILILDTIEGNTQLNNLYEDLKFVHVTGLGSEFKGAERAACPEIVTRAGWGARAPRSAQQMGPAVGHVFIHHTAGATCTDKASCSKVARATQNFHMDTKRWPDIGYSFLVGGDGRIYEGRGWKGVGAHTVNYNSKALGISFMGNFDKVMPSASMINAARKLIDCGVQKGFITKAHQIHGHRDAACTACPGAALYKNVQGWVGFKGGKLPGYKC